MVRSRSVRVRVQGAVLVWQKPVQCVNTDELSGVAVSVTVVPM
jgi:hypothetical protein